MSIRVNLFGLLLFMPMAVFASDAIIYAVVYECDSESVNQDLVQICSGQYPQALTKWRDRNSIKARIAKDRCAVDLQERAKDISGGEVEAIRKMIEETRANIRNKFLNENRPLLKSEWVQYWSQGRAKPGAANPLRQY